MVWTCEDNVRGEGAPYELPEWYQGNDYRMRPRDRWGNVDEWFRHVVPATPPPSADHAVLGLGAEIARSADSASAGPGASDSLRWRWPGLAARRYASTPGGRRGNACPSSTTPCSQFSAVSLLSVLIGEFHTATVCEQSGLPLSLLGEHGTPYEYRGSS